MDVETESIREQNVAMERIKYFLHNCLDSSIFILDSEKKVIEKYMTAGLKVCLLPEEPYDQIITTMLLVKLNAIVEGRLSITNIVLGSKLSDDIKFDCSYDTPLGPFSKNGWWSTATTHIIDAQKNHNKKEKIVKLIKPVCADWDDVDLMWAPGSDKQNTEIVFSFDPEK